MLLRTYPLAAVDYVEAQSWVPHNILARGLAYGGSHDIQHPVSVQGGGSIAPIIWLESFRIRGSMPRLERLTSQRKPALLTLGYMITGIMEADVK
jgi:hypothetical protein